MARYQDKDVRFDAPLDWEDRTIVSFSAPRRAEQPVTPNLVVTRDVLDDPRVSLDAYAERQFVELARRLRELEFVDRKTTQVGGAPAIEFRFKQKSVLGLLEQRMIMFRKGDKQLTITTTVAASEAEQQDPLFDRIIATFDLDPSSQRTPSIPASNGHVRSTGSPAR